MAINFSKFVPTTVKPTSKLDFSKFLPKDYVEPVIKTSYLPEFLGGGAYNTAIGQPNKLITTQRGTAGITEDTSAELHHIIPVEFGGSSETDKNILALGEDAHQRITDAETIISRDYKNKKISLPEARQKMMAALQAEQDAQKGGKQGVGANILGGIKDLFLHPIQSVKQAIGVNQQTTQAVQDLIESTKIREPNLLKTATDFANEIKNNWDNAVDKLSEAALVSEGEPKSKQAGKTFEAWTAMAGLVFSPITAAFEASKNLPIIGGIASAINLPLAVGGDAANNLSNLGLDALVASKKIKQETADNLRQGVNEISVLASQIVIAGKMFKGKELETVKKELETKYSKQDAKTIIKKAEERATAELAVKPVVEAPKIDFNKFIPKKEETPIWKEANKKEAKPITYKPVKTAEINTPEIKTSKLALGVEEKAIAKKLTQGFENLPEYVRVNVEQQARAANEMVKKRLNESIEIAKGNRLPPEGILPEAIFTAVEEYAIKTKDVTLLQDLAQSKLTTEATGMGQRIRLLAERVDNSPVGKMKEVVENRRKYIEEKTGKKESELTREELKKIKEEMRKSKPTKDAWIEFVNSIVC